MAHPLIYPSGEPGWHYGISHVQEHVTAQRTTVTLLQFHIFRWADRGHQSSSSWWLSYTTENGRRLSCCRVITS